MSISAEDVVVKIRADMADFEGKMQRAGTVTGNMAARVEQSTRQTAAATRNMGRQIADVGSSLASGSSPFLVLAQQAPQMADALADSGGRAAKVAAFFAGPWGAALLAAGSVVGVLVGELLNSGEAADSLTKKLEDNAIKGRASADAQRIFETSLYGAADASAKLNSQLTRQNQTQLQVAQSALAAAEALRQSNLQNLRKEVADAAIARRIAQTTADSSLYLQGGTVGGSSGFGQSLARARASTELARATDRERIAREGLAQAEKAVVQARVPLLDIKAIAASDESAAATLRHEQALSRLRDEYTRTGDQAAYLAGRTKIESQLTQDQEAIQKRGTAATKEAAEAKRQHAKAVREAAKAARELERAQRELEQSLKSITSAFDPAKAAANTFRDTLDEIDKLQMNGLISSVDALSYKLKAAQDQARTLADQVAKGSEAGFLAVGIRPGEMDGSEIRNQIDNFVERRQEDRERKSPLEAYRDDIAKISANMNDQIQSVAVDGLQMFNDGLVDAIMNSENLADVFGNVAKSIVADLIRIAVQQTIVNSLVKGLSGILGGGAMAMPSSAPQMSLPSLPMGFATGGYTGNGPAHEVAGVVHRGEYVMPASAVQRIGVDNLAALANGRAAASMAGVTAAGAGARPVQQTIIVKVEANDYFDAKVQQGATAVAAPMAMASGMQARSAAGNDAARAARRRIPGR